jgi:Ca2+-binding EF-hand superfamily protein
MAVDCADTDCSMSEFMPIVVYCRERNGPENTLDRCRDEIDNDGNSYVDCNDFSCSRSTDPEIIAHCASIAEHTLERCMNGIDDDANGFVDCNDFSCTRADRGASPEAIEYCANADETTLEECTNGIDDEGDGFIDCADFSCTREDRGASLEAIQYCGERAEIDLARCSDGVDNDGNGFIDCMDFSCSRSSDSDVALYCRERTEGTIENCRDGQDNDGNGFTDCADRGCSGFQALLSWALSSECTAADQRCTATNGEPGRCFLATGRPRPIEGRPGMFEGPNPAEFWICATLQAPCLETPSWSDDSALTALPDYVGLYYVEERDFVRDACIDGIDNDGDGFVDCDDWECNWNPLTRDICADENGRAPVCG